MKKLCIFALSFFCSIALANENRVIHYSNESIEGQENFFLIGTQKGSYTVKSWQFDMNKSTWDGNSEPRLTIREAVSKAYSYFNKTTAELGVKDVQFKPAFSREGTTIWYYLVTLTTLPYQFDSDEFEIAVLLSGELLEAKGK